MIALLLSLQAAPAAVTNGAFDDVFTCEYLDSAESKQHEPLRNDLTIRHWSMDGAERWTVAWPGKSPVEATPFAAQFRNEGGGDAFRWTESSGEMRTAFFSRGDVVMMGIKVAWLSFEKPSWQAPGYSCATPARNSAKAVQ